MAAGSLNMDFPNGSGNNTLVLCDLRYRHFIAPDGELWCSWAWDSILCWPPTKASTTAKQRCPLENGVDTTKFVEKRCDDNGRWEDRGGPTGERNSPNGWTNYTPCFTREMLLLIRKLYAGNEDAAKVKLDIAKRTRTLEFVGLSISLAALLISLAIFCRFRSLRNTRTRIHKNLFVAMVIQVLIRLTLYIDQAVLRTGTNSFQHGIENTPVLCEASYVLLEYARTAMFMWMFIEGLFLHNMVTVTVFQETSYYRMYRLVGWGYPVVMTLTWAIVTAVYYHPSKCWWGYNLTFYFWILEGPRMAVILLNFLFLLNIIRVLVVKLRQSHTSEIEQARKAVRAAVLLLPLLGITNLISMTEAPLEKAAWEFALWSYTTHFLTSFQGLFIATLYCFLNGEVRLALGKTISVYLSLRGTEVQNRRQSTFSGCQPHRITSVIEVEEEELRSSGWIRLCCRGEDTPPSDRPAETTV
ncbi:PDF receptor [Cephus cinctus]|uniref:PDF receptor n=1 Tax=Cephus cinctus TaxID=211228 RepID=A0AAJ7VZY1_CEPCN|nr:PDF receptor [Cephus cinctus]XP_024939438.1 PDF receptor [Cephus cinctus]XP_024939439.1 PDF receptor [Cephus cinctus]XP_024939440.1 PDF receptor [Cephus cinctus]XP_024939441.1 PDF receptor [Cephus cinctus]XP_024939442.1 PDF receptor [Cephus cinctus]